MIYYYNEVKKFCEAYHRAVNQTNKGLKAEPLLRETFINKMILDEIEEMRVAKDETEKIDALLDIFYYSMNALVSCGFDAKPLMLGTKQSPTKKVCNECVIVARIHDRLRPLPDLDQKSKKLNIAVIAAFCFNEIMNSGHDFKRLFDIVHTANMTKFTLPGGSLGESGKWNKPPAFVAPDAELRRVIES